MYRLIIYVKTTKEPKNLRPWDIVSNIRCDEISLWDWIKWYWDSNMWKFANYMVKVV